VAPRPPPSPLGQSPHFFPFFLIIFFLIFICLILRVFYVNFDFKLGYLSLFTNLTDGMGGNSMKMVVICSVLVDVSIRSGMLTMAGS
jgi:hypothetical protein